jgi:hypothetical protein
MDQTAKRHYEVRETDAVDYRHPVDELEPLPEEELAAIEQPLL